MQPQPLLPEDTVFSHNKEAANAMLEALNYGSQETGFYSIIPYLCNSQGPFSGGIICWKGKHEPQTG